MFLETTYETIITSVEGRVATIRLNRPKALNALNTTAMRELVGAEVTTLTAALARPSLSVRSRYRRRRRHPGDEGTGVPGPLRRRHLHGTGYRRFVLPLLLLLSAAAVSWR